MLHFHPLFYEHPNNTLTTHAHIHTQHCALVRDDWGAYIEHVEAQDTVEMEPAAAVPSLITRRTMPVELRSQYARCNRPPRFRALGKKREGFSREAYSDPSFFFDSFLAQEKERNKREKDERRADRDKKRKEREARAVRPQPRLHYIIHPRTCSYMLIPNRTQSLPTHLHFFSPASL